MADGEVVELVDRLAAVVAALVASPVDAVAEPEASRLHAAVGRARDALGVVSARMLARVEDQGAWVRTDAGRGARDFEEYVARTSRGSRARAKQQTRLAQAVREESVPGLAAAVTAGRVPLEHADVLTRLGPTTPARRAALRSADPRANADHLLGKAAQLGVGQLVTEIKRWAARIDPTADEQGHRDAAEKVSCTLSPRDDGVAVSAFLTAVDGAAFDAALAAVAGVPAANDERTHAQRMGAALGDMARLVLDHGLAATRSGGFRPHLTVQVSWDTLVAQVNAVSGRGGDAPEGAPGTLFPAIPEGFDPATLADGTPIPASVLARLACDAEVSRVVFGPDSQLLDVGRTERLYSGALRRAIVARDRHCAYPGCDRPPRFGEVHHIEHWAAHHGETSAANGVLLCWHHHDVVHSRYLSITRNHAAGRWDFYEGDGSPVLPPAGPAPPGPPPSSAASSPGVMSGLSPGVPVGPSPGEPPGRLTGPPDPRPGLFETPETTARPSHPTGPPRRLSA